MRYRNLSSAIASPIPSTMAMGYMKGPPSWKKLTTVVYMSISYSSDDFAVCSDEFAVVPSDDFAVVPSDDFAAFSDSK